MTVAAFLLLATGLSVLGLFGGDAAKDAARALADHISRQIDALAATGGAVTVRGGVAVSGPLELPPTLAGSTYRIEFRASEVRVLAGRSIESSVLRNPVHPFARDGANYASSELGSRDGAVLEIRPEVGFVVERALVTVDGRPGYLSFVHLP